MNTFFMALMLLLNEFNDIAIGEKDTKEQKDQSNQRSVYKPLMIIKHTSIDEYGEKFDMISLPSDFKIFSDSTKTYATKPDEKQAYLCPAEAHISEIRSLSQYCRDIDYCLFEKSFKENEEKICESAVKPSLIYSNAYDSAGCRISATHKFYTFSIKYCSTLDYLRTEVEKWKKEHYILEKLPACFGGKKDDLITPLNGVLYDICYNTTVKQTLWTRHKILAPLLLENGNWEDEPTADSKELSVEPFMVPNQFAEMDNAFRNQDESSPNYMVPRMLVPMEDVPFEIWKKATSHFINIAPLWIELQSLMNAIDNGIRKAAITLQKRFRRKNSVRLDRHSETVHILKIYTKIYNMETTANPGYLDSKKRFLIPDIWCKFVYHEGRGRDIVIFVHNTPGSYPDVIIEKQCNTDEEVFCDFKKWTNDNLDEEVTKYAYCCMVSTRILKSTFPYAEMAQANKLLDIDGLIEGDPDEPLDQPLILTRRDRTKEEIERHYFASKTTNTDPLSNDAIVSESDEIYLCPVETPEDEYLIKEISIYHRGFKFCLIEKNFTNEETKMCKKEIEPMLISDEKSTTQPHTCGPTQTDFVMKFVFAYCFSSEWLKDLEKNTRDKSRPKVRYEFTEDTPLIDMYDICYNNSEMRTTYTRHRITSSSLLQEASSLNENTYNCNKISVEPYNMHEKFSKMRIAFEYQDETNPDRMTPQMLVPAEDMVLPLWKKTTCHYVNIAPLWHELVLLLDLVNTQIRNLAIKKSKELLIHTMTLTYEYDGYQLPSPRNNNFNALLSIPNIWCKMVYNEMDRSGIAIIIHNTPDNPPRPHQLCEERAECDFENWLDESKLSFDKGYLKYAYCCQVTEQVKAFYGLKELEIEGILDINNAINDIPME